MTEFRFDPKEHRYFYGDEELISVTRVLEAMRISDSSWIKQEYRDRGTAVHDICDLIDDGTTDQNFATPEDLIDTSQWEPGTTTPELVGYGMAYASFRVAAKFEPLLIEERLYCSSLRLAGTLDRFGTWANGNGTAQALIDIKSGVPTISARIQTALYQYMLEVGSRTGVVDIRAAVHLQPDGKFRIYRYEDKQDIQVGLSAVNLYHWMKNNKLL